MWDTLDQAGTNFLRGQLILISAGPGTGKSAFVLSLALLSGVPTLYFSADSDSFTQTTRAISILTGRKQQEVVQQILSEDLSPDVLELMSKIPIRLIYDANPSVSTLENAMEAYEEVYGEYPELIALDNLTNVQASSGDSDDPFDGLEGLLDYLHSMSRATEACVICLHHVTGGYNDTDRPIPLSGVKQQITRVPETVLTIHKRHGDDFNPATLCVSTVKQRGGKADPSGRSYVELDFEPERMRITDPPTNYYEPFAAA